MPAIDRSRPTSALVPAIAVALVAASFGCAAFGGAQRERARELDLRRAESKFNLGVDHLVKGRTELAIRSLRAAKELKPNSPRVDYVLAEAHRRKGRTDDAEQLLLRALEIRPDFQDARLSLSALFIQLARYADGATQAQKLVDDPTFRAPWRALTNLGWSQFRLGQYEDARRNLELAIDYRASYRPALLNLGILEGSQGHHLEALDYFQRVLDSNPGPRSAAETNYHMGEVYVSLGRRQRALQHFMAAVAVSENSGLWSKQSEEYLRRLH